MYHNPKSCSTNTPATTTSPMEVHGGATTFSTLHPDIINTHILTRLDGPSLTSASSSCTILRHLSSQDELWSGICHATWPSSSNPRVNRVISLFAKGGPRAFFANSYSLPPLEPMSSNPNRKSLPSELISAVDIHYQNKLIFTKVHETETVTRWFRCSPFRIDLLEPKDVVPTPIEFPFEDDTFTFLMDNVLLSWILIDPNQRLAVNLSSHKPVSVQRHWLTGEVQVRFCLIQKGIISSSNVQVGIVVIIICSGSKGGELQVKEVSLEVEDINGRHLNGKDSLVILQRTLEGKRGKGVKRVEESRKRYEEFLVMKRQRNENKLKREWILDTLCVAFGAFIFIAFWILLLCR